MLGAFVFLFISGFSYASTQVVGNGGDGIRENEKVYSFDLYEHGLQDTAKLGNSSPDAGLFIRLESALPIFENNTITQLASKLQDLSSQNPSLSFGFLKAFEFYRWEFSDSALPDIDDENLGSNQEFAGKLVQLAVRSHYTISIDRSLFQKMDEANRVALLIHEAAHAIIQPQADESGNFSFQDARRVRLLVSTIFSREKGAHDVFDAAGFRFPNSLEPVVFQNKSHLVLKTSLRLRLDGQDTGPFELPHSASGLEPGLLSAVSDPRIRSVEVVGVLDSFFFEPKIYKGKTGSLHWHLGFSRVMSMDNGPRLNLTAKHEGAPLVHGDGLGLTFENMCGDGLYMSFRDASESRFAYAYPCLREWLKSPTQYF